VTHRIAMTRAPGAGPLMAFPGVGRLATRLTEIAAKVAQGLESARPRNRQSIPRPPNAEPNPARLMESLVRLHHALTTLDSLLFIAATGEGGRARFLAGCGGLAAQVEEASAAMRRLAIVMWITGDDALAPPEPLTRLRSRDDDRRLDVWWDLTYALRYLVQACSAYAAPRANARVLGDRPNWVLGREVDAVSVAVERLCLTLADLGLTGSERLRPRREDLPA